jgi:hypothetical protein
MRSKAHTAQTARYKKIIINGQMRNKPFLIVIYHSSLVKGSMNAELVFLNVYGAPESIPRNEFRQPM